MNATAIAALLLCPGPHTPNYDHPQVSYELVCKLVELEAIAPYSVRFTSGVRCPMHNEAVGGGTTSRHLEGEGVDITVEPKAFMNVLMLALRLNFRVLIEGDHLHLDLGKPGSARLLVQTADGWQPVGPPGCWTITA